MKQKRETQEANLFRHRLLGGIIALYLVAFLFFLLMDLVGVPGGSLSPWDSFIRGGHFLVLLLALFLWQRDRPQWDFWALLLSLEVMVFQTTLVFFFTQLPPGVKTVQVLVAFQLASLVLGTWMQSRRSMVLVQTALSLLFLFFQLSLLGNMGLGEGFPEQGTRAHELFVFTLQALFLWFVFQAFAYFLNGALYRLFRDLSRSREAMKDLAFLDGLTGFKNQNSLSWDLSQVLSEHKDGQRILLLGMDFSNFSRLNRIYGYKVSNQILVEAARVLRREFPDKSWYRGIGATFFLLEGPLDTLESGAYRERIRSAFRMPIRGSNTEFILEPRVAQALFPEDEENGDDLVVSVLARLNEEDQSGVSALPGSLSSVDVRLHRALDEIMPRAINTDEIQFHYQAKIDLAGGFVHGAEALARWNSEELGPVSPGEFIPWIEESSFLGDFTLRSFHQAHWAAQEAHKRGARGRISVNLCPRLFSSPDFFQLLGSWIDTENIHTELLEVEITESALARDRTLALDRCRQLKDLGFTLSLDDFGTGYSNLGHMRDFPLDILKVDRRFMDDLEKGRDELVQAIISMAKSLKLKVVAEGVETLQQVQRLQQWNCDYIQGFYFSPALAHTDWFRFLENWKGL